MFEFNTSLVREKFSIHDASVSLDPVVALSNRIVVELTTSKGKLEETFVIRAHNMHSCVRMAARLIKSYETAGPIMNRPKAYDWDASWDAVVNDYEHRFNPQRWIAIYARGKPVYSAGDHHIFLDVIEQCDARSDKGYEHAIPLAEDAFKQAGKIVRIAHDSNVALVVSIEKTSARLGVIMRGPYRTTTFTMTIAAKGVDSLNIPQCLAAAAAYLEGVQLAFLVGMNHEKIKLGIIERFSEEEKKTKEARSRLSRLAGEIANLESAYDVRYRPERPKFQHILMDAEKLAQKVLVPPDKDKDVL
jgi:hypothetical protein